MAPMMLLAQSLLLSTGTASAVVAAQQLTVPLLPTEEEASAYDMGPTFGADYAGDDYNCTPWNTPKSGSANNYAAAAMVCESYCLADVKCCAWTYCPPGSGVGDVVLDKGDVRGCPPGALLLEGPGPA
eukprot:SAG22_NODE_550_length_9202_cov_30.666484_10_plen_128_part_00